MPRFGPHTEETKRKISAGQHTEYAKARRAEAMAKYWDDVHSGNKPMPLRTGRAPKLVEERFWSKVVKSDDPDGCWIFTGSHGSSIKNRHKSYGSVNLRGATEQERFLYVRSGAHVISWTIHFGRVPDGFDVLHKCDNRRCVNPEHLFLGTNQDNMDDMVAKGRSLKGEKSPIHKLTEQDVLEIRRLYATGQYSQARLGEMFGVIQNNVSKIVCRRIWTHI